MKPLLNRPNLKGWCLNSINEANSMLEVLALKIAEEAIECAMKDEMTHISFPVEWDSDPSNPEDCESSDGHRGRTVKDPLTMHLDVALDCGDFHSPTYEFNLRDALKDSLLACAEDGSFSYGLGRLSASLRDLADEIDDAIRSAPKG